MIIGYYRNEAVLLERLAVMQLHAVSQRILAVNTAVLCPSAERLALPPKEDTEKTPDCA